MEEAVGKKEGEDATEEDGDDDSKSDDNNESDDDAMATMAAMAIQWRIAVCF